jgi:arginine repressor
MRIRKRELVEALRIRMDELGLKRQEDLVAWLGKRGVMVHQSTISRLLSSSGHTISPKMKEACNYAGIPWTEFAVSPDPKTCKPVLEAVAAAWDGTADHARRLARLIHAASALPSRG